MNDSNKIIKATQEEHDAAIALMRTFMCSDKPKVGVFWYDFVNNSLFGVEKGEVDIYLTNEDMATLPKTHKEYRGQTTTLQNHSSTSRYHQTFAC